MVSWCCKQLGLPVKKVHQITFRKRHTSSRSGYCYYARGVIVVSINPTASIETLVDVTAHELAHRMLYLAGDRSRQSRRYGHSRGGGSEHNTQWHANQVLAAFGEKNVSLLQEWNKEPARTKAKPISLADKKLQAVQDGLVRWQRKLKLAQTKIKKLKRKMSYYERRKAATSKPLPLTISGPAILSLNGVELGVVEPPTIEVKP